MSSMQNALNSSAGAGGVLLTNPKNGALLTNPKNGAGGGGGVPTKPDGGARSSPAAPPRGVPNLEGPSPRGCGEGPSKFGSRWARGCVTVKPATSRAL